MKNKNIYIGFILGLLSLSLFRCTDDVEPQIEELDLKRVLTPLELKAIIRNKTTAEFSWKVRDDADSYVLEISEDQFATVVKTLNVLPDELPYQVALDGETQYSARVKGVSEHGKEASKWATIAFQTDVENIFFLPVPDEDIQATTVTLRWPAGSEVTHFTILPGDINRQITAEEKADGFATIDGLTGFTEYTVKLFKESKQRGQAIFKTLPDIGTATAVYPEDDLNAVITAAAPGDVLVLFPGNYTVYTGSIILNKSISIRGYYPNDKPKLHVQFSLEGPVPAVELSNVDLSGDGTLTDVFRYNTAAVEYGSLVIAGCNIHDFARSFVAGNVASKVASLTIDNCILTNIITSGGDLIDFRTTYIADVSITNSTFNNCAPGRDFVRIDAAAGYTGTGLTSNVLIDHCTLYGVSNTQDRILYVRFAANTLAVKNTLIAATDGYYSNQTGTSQPTCLNNNYFNAAGFYTPAYVAGAKIDESGTYTTLDPGFANAAQGDFTLSNQTLKDNAVGDPRWRL